MKSTRTSLVTLPKRNAGFIEPMDCAPVSKLIEGPGWLYEIKLDGYRAIAVKSDRSVNLFSRRHKSFDYHYPLIVEALGEPPEGTVVDGEIVAKTLILTIQKTATKVDTSPEALIQLKTAGMSDAVLNAMLTASSAPTTDVKVNQSTQQDCSQALDKVLASVGSPEKIASVHSSNFVGTSIVNRASGASTFHP